MVELDALSARQGGLGYAYTRVAMTLRNECISESLNSVLVFVLCWCSGEDVLYCVARSQCRLGLARDMLPWPCMSICTQCFLFYTSNTAHYCTQL